MYYKKRLAMGYWKVFILTSFLLKGLNCYCQSIRQTISDTINITNELNQGLFDEEGNIVKFNSKDSAIFILMGNRNCINCLSEDVPKTLAKYPKFKAWFLVLVSNISNVYFLAAQIHEKSPLEIPLIYLFEDDYPSTSYLLNMLKNPTPSFIIFSSSHSTYIRNF